LASIVAAIFLLSASGMVQLMQSWNSGSEFATTDMLTSAWNSLVGTILPEAAGLAVVGAIFNYARQRPFIPWRVPRRESTSAIDMVWYRDPGFAPGMAPLYCCCLFIIPVCKSGSSGSRDKAVTNLQEDWSPNNA